MCGVDNLVIAIESHSVSFGIKPNYKIIDNLYINANLGFHRWDQSENTYWPDSGSASTLDSYGGTDVYMGTGIDYRNKNFTFGIEYLEHTMMYDAQSFVGSLKYNF